MDAFFSEQFGVRGDAFWLECEALHVNQSAFEPYENRPMIGFVTGNDGNANKKMIQFLRRINSGKTNCSEPERERGKRHVINERQRREREKQNYSALHSLLPPGTKNDKNTIITAAAQRIQELQRCKQELQRENGELKLKLGKCNVEGTKIRVTVDNPKSGVESMLEVLKCLKNSGSRTTSIRTKFSDQKLTAILDVETQMRAGEVEEAVQRTLQQVEQRLP